MRNLNGKALPATLCLLAVASAGLTAQTTEDQDTVPPHRVPRVDLPVRVDGVLDEACWESALVLDLPYEIGPGENTPAPVRTEVLLAILHSADIRREADLYESEVDPLSRSLFSQILSLTSSIPVPCSSSATAITTGETRTSASRKPTAHSSSNLDTHGFYSGLYY